MAKNKKVMSAAIDPALHDELKDYCERKDVSVSGFLGDLISKAIKLPVDEESVVMGKSSDDEVLKVLLRVPKTLKSDADGLKKWMDEQTTRLVAKLGG